MVPRGAVRLGPTPAHVPRNRRAKPAMLHESSEKSGKFNDRARKSPEFPGIFDLHQQVVPKNSDPMVGRCGFPGAEAALASAQKKAHSRQDAVGSGTPARLMGQTRVTAGTTQSSHGRGQMRGIAPRTGSFKHGLHFRSPCTNRRWGVATPRSKY